MTGEIAWDLFSPFCKMNLLVALLDSPTASAEAALWSLNTHNLVASLGCCAY